MDGNALVSSPGKAEAQQIGDEERTPNPHKIAKQNPEFQLSCIHLVPVLVTSMGPAAALGEESWLRLARTQVNNECATHKCRSSMICMLSQGTTMHASHRSNILPPANPVIPTAVAPTCFAILRAFSTLAELPLALMAKAMSPGTAKFANCSAKMFS